MVKAYQKDMRKQVKISKKDKRKVLFLELFLIKDGRVLLIVVLSYLIKWGRLGANH